MASRLPRFAAQLLVVFLAGVGADAAWNLGYYATFLICGLLAVWTAAHAFLRTYSRRNEDALSESAWTSAVLQREREARSLVTFLDHAPVPLLALREDGRLEALNLAARRFFAADALVAEPPEGLVAAVLSATPGRPQTLTLETAGKRRAFGLTVSELVSEGHFVQVVALVDIEAEIQAAEAAALKELIQVLSHEIMNSLTPVTSLAQTAADLLRDAGDAGSLPQVRDAADSIARRSEGLLRFVGAYRELARLPEATFAAVSLCALLEDVALLFRSRWGARGVQLEVEAPRPDVSISLDRDLISQTLLNVLANAAESALEVSHAPRVRLAAMAGVQGQVRISVDDNGAGVNLTDPSVVFRPFFTTKPGGTGVGLSLARQVVMAHGGEIGVRCSALGGAAFTITL